MREFRGGKINRRSRRSIIINRTAVVYKTLISLEENTSVGLSHQYTISVVSMCEESVKYIDAINVSICTWYVSPWWASYYMHVPLFGVDWVGRALCLDLLTENGIVDLAHRSTPPLR